MSKKKWTNQAPIILAVTSIVAPSIYFFDKMSRSDEATHRLYFWLIGLALVVLILAIVTLAKTRRLWGLTVAAMVLSALALPYLLLVYVWTAA